MRKKATAIRICLQKREVLYSKEKASTAVAGIAVNGEHFCAFYYRLPLDDVTALEVNGTIQDVRIRQHNLFIYPDPNISRPSRILVLTTEEPLVDFLPLSDFIYRFSSNSIPRFILLNDDGMREDPPMGLFDLNPDDKQTDSPIASSNHTFSLDNIRVMLAGELPLTPLSDMTRGKQGKKFNKEQNLVTRKPSNPPNPIATKCGPFLQEIFKHIIELSLNRYDVPTASSLLGGPNGPSVDFHNAHRFCLIVLKGQKIADETSANALSAPEKGYNIFTDRILESLGNYLPFKHSRNNSKQYIPGDCTSRDPPSTSWWIPECVSIDLVDSLMQNEDMKQDLVKTAIPVNDVQTPLQTSKDREALRASLGPLGQKYIEAVLRGVQDKESGINHVYGVYLHKDGMMFGNKRFDMDDADNIIIDGVRYAGTPDLYELIFKRIPNGALYTEDDMHKYKSMLLANAHEHKHHSQGRLLSNRGYKYKNT
ncbi:hypothetical protein G5I_05021 [Acromyrmex echinatior]|uniref:Uncharacterized protein n=1 Tax=Acromyrmex echinatior TaxID=103372 RepID=F4WH66_ACREC|nr:hypothetical protein G5I_05021 [Acromyrmex echinatior]